MKLSLTAPTSECLLVTRYTPHKYFGNEEFDFPLSFFFSLEIFCYILTDKLTVASSGFGLSSVTKNLNFFSLGPESLNTFIV